MEQKIKIDSFKVEKEIKALLLEKSSEFRGEEKTKDQVYLLSFHDDGVVWGKIKKDGSLITSDFAGSPSPECRSETLQELRLFGEKGQLHVWRKSETEFQASLALESYLKDFEPIDEKQVLHGTDFDGGNQDFTIVRDGSEGLRHAFPQPIQTDKFDGKKCPLRLHVKHYIEYDNDGCARIAFSRLVNVSVE